MNLYGRFSVKELKSYRDQLRRLITRSANPDTQTGRIYDADSSCTAASELNRIEIELANRAKVTIAKELPIHDPTDEDLSKGASADTPDPESGVDIPEDGDDSPETSTSEIGDDTETFEGPGEDVTDETGGEDLQSKIDAATERSE